LNILEMHDLYANFFLREGEKLSDFPRNNDKRKDRGYIRRKKLDYADLHARPITTNYTYGEVREFPWQSAQGIMTCGYLQMTPRSDFHSSPKPVFRHFGNGATGAMGFPYYTDDKTPLRRNTPNWFTRHRDFMWTLNQASLKMTRTGEREITVELGNSQPFFKHYVVDAEGKRTKTDKHQFIWKLKPGRNTLAVNCADEFGQEGIPSTVTLELK
jgi:hypothetical protein